MSAKSPVEAPDKVWLCGAVVDWEGAEKARVVGAMGRMGYDSTMAGFPVAGAVGAVAMGVAWGAGAASHGAIFAGMALAGMAFMGWVRAEAPAARRMAERELGRAGLAWEAEARARRRHGAF